MDLWGISSRLLGRDACNKERCREAHNSVRCHFKSSILERPREWQWTVKDEKKKEKLRGELNYTYTKLWMPIQIAEKFNLQFRYHRLMQGLAGKNIYLPEAVYPAANVVDARCGVRGAHTM